MTPGVVELAQVLFTVLMFIAGLTVVAHVSKTVAMPSGVGGRHMGRDW